MSRLGDVKVDVLDANNFAEWHMDIAQVLSLENLQGYISSPPPENFKFVKKDDDRAKAIIYLRVHKKYKVKVNEAQTALAAWKALEAVFLAKNDGMKQQLWQDLTTIKQMGTEDLTAYFARGRDIMDSLILVGETVTEKNALTHILNGLESVYDHAVEILQLQGTNDNASLDQVLAKLFRIEAKITAKQKEEEVNALVMSVGRFSRKGNSTKQQTCFYCGKTGHIRRFCRKKQEDEAMQQDLHGKDPPRLHFVNAF